MTLEELQVKVTAKTEGIESKMSRLNSKFAELGKSSQNAGKGIGKAFQNIDKAIKASAIGAVVVFIVKAISKMSQFVGECTKLGSDLAEVQNVVDVTFGDMANQVNNFASNSIKDLGMSETACKKYTSTMGAMLKSSGFDTSSALTMSKTITQLTADMASFYNLGTEEAFEKIRSGISGETEPLTLAA